MGERVETSSDTSEQIECPACGENITDLWDHNWDHECIEIECSHCDAPLVLCRAVYVTYTCRAAKVST